MGIDSDYRYKFVPKLGLKEANIGVGATAIILSLFVGGYVGGGMAVVAGFIAYINNKRIKPGDLN